MVSLLKSFKSDKSQSTFNNIQIPLQISPLLFFWYYPLHLLPWLPLLQSCWPSFPSKNTWGSYHLKTFAIDVPSDWNALLPNTCMLAALKHFLMSLSHWSLPKSFNLKLQPAPWHSWSPLTCQYFSPSYLQTLNIPCNILFWLSSAFPN